MTFPHARLAFRIAPALLVLVLHAAAFEAAAQDETLDLRPMWREGQVARYQITQTQTTRAEMAAGDQAQSRETVSRFSGELTWRVVQPDENGGGTAELTIDDLNITVTGPDGEQRSASPSRADEMMEPFQQWLGAMVGRPVTYVVSSTGDISSVRGFDAIRQQAGEMGGGLDERYFRNLGRDLAAIVGGGENASLGGSWNSQQTASHQLGEVAADVTYTVLGVEEPAGVRTATIERRAALELTPELPELPAEGPELDFRQTAGESRGFLMFDLTRHEIVGYFARQEVAAEISFILPDRRMTQTMVETTDTEMLRISEE